MSGKEYRLIGLQIKELRITAWCPDEEAEEPPEQVHVIIRFKDEYELPDLVIRFKSPDGLNNFLRDMERMRDAVWPDWPEREFDAAYQGPTVCQRCNGCGQIADSEDGEPWSVWEALPAGSDLAVRMGLVQPVECPGCGGSGQVPYSGVGGPGKEEA